MAQFPVLNSLAIRDYDLFPGTKPAADGLEAEFHPGLTLILGANGLGKTTLVWVLYRLLVGPYDIPGLDTGGDLGGRRLQTKLISGPRRRIFAERVVDRAENAIATLSFGLGPNDIVVSRGLSDLKLLEFKVNGESQPLEEVDSYQLSVAEMAGVWSFGDWILLLRYLTFYFEDRRELVWDSSAQRQVLRLLFLAPQSAQLWTAAEREVLELDSRFRNLRAAISREERALATEEGLVDQAMDVRQELESLVDLQETDEDRLVELDEDLLELDAERQDARLQVLKAEQHREATFREFEHAKLAALEARFPSSSDTARYILAQLLTDGECLACGSEVPGVVQLLETRLTASQCVICGSQLPVPAESDGLAEISDERVTRTVSGLADADKALESARNRLDRADARYHETHHGLQEITTAIAKRRERIDALLRRLPKELADVHKQREELALLRQRLAILSEELSSSETGFSEFISGVRNSLVAKAPAIKEVFERYARDFLLEDCSLVWSERKERVGQSGFQVKFPTFELDMASATFASPVRRSGPDQVSESQREFIDLSFRIALMKAGDPELGGTLVVDAPEASLDAVFVHRAADVLSVFADPALENRLLITSNLTNGELIPKLLAGVSTGVMLNRIIDLFEIAEPTAAVREMGDEYARVRRKIFGRDQETEGEDQ